MLTDSNGIDIRLPLRCAKSTQVEYAVVASGDAWLRAQTIAREFGSSASPNSPNRREITLSDSQLLAVAGSALFSIFVFVWAVIKLWLSGR